MNGRERVFAILRGDSADRPPLMPIVHAALAPLAGVPLGRFFTDAQTMAEVIAGGCTRFGFDGVQLSLGVSAEPEALGARVDQPRDAAPVLREHLLADPSQAADLPVRGLGDRGRFPLYRRAMESVARRVGDRAFVVNTLRGPLNIASQLRGVEEILIDLLQAPDAAGQVLDLTVEIAIEAARATLDCGADLVMFGEATCSPNFISPELYRRLVWPRHRRMIEQVRAMGWPLTGLHVCGNIRPILPDLIATGADLIDVDHQVPAAGALEAAGGRVALRGNLDPIGDFFAGRPEKTGETTGMLARTVAGSRWIVSSGCDIPPGTKAEAIEACRSVLVQSG